MSEADEKLKTENPPVLIIPLDETKKGLQFFILKRSEFELVESNIDELKFRVIKK